MRVNQTGIVLLAALATITFASAALAQTTQPDRNKSLLLELSRETTDLYQQTAGCIVRVEIPRPPTVLDDLGPMNDPLQRWLQLMNPAVRQQLFPVAPGGNPNDAPANAGSTATSPQPPGTNPSRKNSLAEPDNAPLTAKMSPTTQPWNGPIIVRGNGGPLLVLPAPGSQGPQAATLSANSLGIVLDDRGDVMVPVYIDAGLAASGPIVAVMSDGRAVKGTYLGGDHSTNMSVIRLEKFDEHPAVVARRVPEDGALVMLATLDSTRSRLAVWSGATSASVVNPSANPVFYGGPNVLTTTSSSTLEEAAIVNMDGSISGFTLHGRYLPLAPYQAIVAQIADSGAFSRRASLGVALRSVDGNDPARAQFVGLGTRPAIRVMEVFPGKAADRAGIHAGDFILTVAGEPIGLTAALAALVSTHEGTIAVTILRDGVEMPLAVTLEMGK